MYIYGAKNKRGNELLQIFAAKLGTTCNNNNQQIFQQIKLTMNTNRLFYEGHLVINVMHIIYSLNKTWGWKDVLPH